MPLIKINQTLVNPDAVVFAYWDKNELICQFLGGERLRFPADEAPVMWAMLYKDEPGPGKWREEMPEP